MPREEYEARQDGWLAAYAVREADFGGRKFTETAHPYRTCFQRDRDRIVHCSAFRRLDFKTQVFVPHEHDHFRTRLTHTLEVAQVGRDLGRALRLNEDLIEAVALAHDLGHPPFGHTGEAILDELMGEHGGFEHNRQSLRIVDYLEHPYPRFRGLNLSNVVRECLAKHKSRYDVPVSGEFDASEPAPLEGQLVDLADEIAYTSADLEDAMAQGWIGEEDLAELELWRGAVSAAEADAPDAREIHKRIRSCKALLAILADNLLEATLASVDERSIDSPQSARAAGRKCVMFSPAIRRQLDSMQEFLMQRVYLHPLCLAQRDSARQVLRELFAAYVDRPELLPQRYRRRTEADGLHRVACDYVAGMTDRFCRREHHRICG